MKAKNRGILALLMGLLLTAVTLIGYTGGMGEVYADGEINVAISEISPVTSVSNQSSYNFTADHGSFTVSGTNITTTANNSTFTVTNSSITFTFNPNSGYTASLMYDGQNQTISENSCTVTLTKSGNDVNNFEVTFTDGSSGGGSGGGTGGGGGGGATPDPGWGTRKVTVNIDSASRFMLSKSGFEIGFSDAGDSPYSTKITTGTSITSDYDPSVSWIYINCKVSHNYFVPEMVAEITYADDTHETASDGTADMGDSNLAVNIPIKNNKEKKGDVSINLKLMVDKQVDATNTATGVNTGTARYNITSNGETNISDDKTVALTVADATENDTAVEAQYGNSLVETFDIGMTVDGTATHQFNDAITVTMFLDTATYNAGSYTVVRNHNNTLTELDTYYDAATGELSFESDQFSDYSLVVKSNATAATGSLALAAQVTDESAVAAAAPGFVWPDANIETEGPTSPKTSDDLPYGLITVMVLFVSVAGGVLIYRRKAGS